MWALTPRQLSSKNSQSHLATFMTVVLDIAPCRTIPVTSTPIAATAVRSSPQLCWPRVVPRRSCRPGLGGYQAPIRCARSVAGIIACTASVAELRRSWNLETQLWFAAHAVERVGEGNPPGPSHRARLQSETNDDDSNCRECLRSETNATRKSALDRYSPRLL